MLDYYLLFKFLHIVSFTAWMAGMFYLPRLFVYHSEEKLNSNTYKKFLVMERKLIKIIMNPAMLLTWLFGLLLLLLDSNLVLQKWLHIKLVLLLFMSGTHGFYSYCSKLFLNRNNNYSSRFYRYINEIPTVLITLIVFLAVFKPMN
tara:strand:- start:400 stop:837 length:438 start_codon:yes stop_codon:yes gene_type:complete